MVLDQDLPIVVELKNNSGSTSEIPENIKSQIDNINTYKEHNNLFSVIDEFTNDFKCYLNEFLEDTSNI